VVNRLRRERISVDWDGALGVPDHLGLISSQVLADLDLIDKSGAASLVSEIVRHLGEQDWEDSDSISFCRNRLNLVSRRDLAIALAGSYEGRDAEELAGSADARLMLVVDARDSAYAPQIQVAPRPPQVPRINEAIYLSWNESADSAARSVALAGEHLTDPHALAWVLTKHGVTTFVLSLMLEKMVETSVAISDVLHRLIQHPGVAELVPSRNPDRAWTRLSGQTEFHPVAVREGTRVRVAGSAGHVLPHLLNIEVRSALLAANQISAAVCADQLTVARLSRIAREWKRAGLSIDFTLV
jgi:hypothetical protein